jgi:hypothetical protein
MSDASTRVRGKPLILLTGATGYVGGRLLKALEQAEHHVRCLARRPEFLSHRVAPTTEVVAGDVLDRGVLPAAMKGVQTAYYLIHSMGSRGAFDEEDRRAAHNFGQAARDAGVQRLIYLGGLGDRGGLSPHLQSRQEVGEILRTSGVQTIEFRASIVIGSGSLSFDMIRALVERLPIMITPRWVSVQAQPIAITDLGTVPPRRPRPGGRGPSHLRNRRRGPDVLPRHYARVRSSARLAPPDDSGPGPDPAAVQPVVGAGHTALRPRRPHTHREYAPPDRRP